MADIIWTPDLPSPSSMDIKKSFNGFAFESPLTGGIQTVEVIGPRWKWTLTWDLLPVARAGALQAIVAQLFGTQTRLTVWNFARPSILGVGGGTPLVKGAGQVGRTINIDGLPNNTQGVYVIGDFLGIGGELKIVTAVVNSNGSGEAAVSFYPPLRNSPADNSAIVTRRPTANFISLNKENGWRQLDPNTVRGFELQLSEDFS